MLKRIIKASIILFYILMFMTLGFYVAYISVWISPIQTDITLSFLPIFISNLFSSLLLMFANLFFGIGILGIMKITFELGFQFYSVVVAYGWYNLPKIIGILSIHIWFEIASMIIIIDCALDILNIWKKYLFGNLNNIISEYKLFLKGKFINCVLIITVLLLIGSILESSISTHLFKQLN